MLNKNDRLIMLTEKKEIPFIGVIILTVIMFLLIYRLQSRDYDLRNSFTNNHKFIFNGPYKLLNSDNISMEQLPYRINNSNLEENDYHKLINLNNFSFIMNDPANLLCNKSNNILVLAVVHSAHENFVKRKAIRNTWGNSMPVVFLLGETNNARQKLLLYKENKKYHDIIQGNFKDNYLNLTYKHVMGFKWLTYYCRSVRYILKVDDDVYVNFNNLNNLIVRHFSSLGARRLILCKISTSKIARRTYRSKWWIKPKDYPNRSYPNYCMGWAILYSPDVIFQLYSEAQKSPYFWIDDVHITGILVEKVNLSHTLLGLQSYLWVDRKNIECHKNDFVVGLTDYHLFYSLWESLDVY